MIPNSSKGLDNLSIISQIHKGFFAMHPFGGIMCPTDDYYGGIAKKVAPMLAPMRTRLKASAEVIVRMALSVAAYFEDQCSGLGLWSAFTHRHRELYGRWLPWYDTSEDYYEDEVNVQDVKFLLWMILVSTQTSAVVPPDDETIDKCASAIFRLLADEFEVAPANEALVDLVYMDDLTEDFYSLKHILMWISNTCYLMCAPWWQMERRNHLSEAIKVMLGSDADRDQIRYMENSYACVRMSFGPLALYPNQWYALMRQQKGITKHNEDILKIQSTPFYPFLVVSKSHKSITLRSCYGIEYKVQLDSFADTIEEKVEPGMIIMTALACYKGKWGANGMTNIISTGQDAAYAEEKLDDMRRMMLKNGQPMDLFAIPDFTTKVNVGKDIAKRMEKTVAANNGRRLFYFPDPQAALEWQSQVMGRPLSDEEGFADVMGQRPLLIYITKDNFMIASDPTPINDPANPYFEPKKAFTGILWLYEKPTTYDEEAAYFVDNNFLTDLSFDPDKPEPKYSALIAENLKSFATFMRQYPC